jgi:hypothetical protein
MLNAEYFDSFNDECPEHKSALNAEYNFSGANVYTFTGCKCAVCYQMDGFKNHSQYFTSYNLAAGRARMIKAMG